MLSASPIRIQMKRGQVRVECTVRFNKVEVSVFPSDSGTARNGATFNEARLARFTHMEIDRSPGQQQQQREFFGLIVRAACLSWGLLE